jgi:hypothetical protein
MMTEVLSEYPINRAALVLCGADGRLKTITTLPEELTGFIHGWLDSVQETTPITGQDILESLVLACTCYADEHGLHL